MLLQILAQAGDSSNLSTLAHLQATVRVSTAVQDMEKIRGEIISAVNGPMLPQLRQRGLDAEYLRLAALQVVRHFCLVFLYPSGAIDVFWCHAGLYAQLWFVRNSASCTAHQKMFAYVPRGFCRVFEMHLRRLR